MSNSYYNHGTYPITNAPGASSALRAELDLVTAGFALLPTLSGNASKALVVNAGGSAVTVTVGTLALAGNFATTGTYNTTLVQGATTSLTLPIVSGTLATLAGTEELTNKTLTSAIGKGTWTASGTWTLPALTVGGVATFTAQPIMSSLTASKPVFTDASKGLTSTGTLAYDQGGTGQTSYAAGDIVYASAINTLAKLTIGSNGQRLVVAAGVPSWATDATIGTVTSVGWTGGIVSVASATTTPAFTIAGNSGGVPYFDSGTTWASSGALTASALVLGGGAGAAPTPMGSLGTTTTVLHGNAGGAPTFAAVSLTADVTGTLPAANGGTGVANNAAMTVTGSGAYAYTRTLTGTTNVTLPTTGTLATLAGTETLTNKTLTSPTLSAPTLGTIASGDGTALTGVAKLTTNTFSGAQIGTVTALTSSGAAMAINLATNNNFSHTTSENTTLSSPSNPVAGQSGVIVITQGATARTLAYNTFWKFAGGTVPTLTATVSAVDTFAYYVESATRATCQLIKDVK